MTDEERKELNQRMAEWFGIKDNDCRGNTTGAVQNLAGTSANKVVADNIF